MWDAVAIAIESTRTGGTGCSIMLVLVVPAVLMRINKTFASRADCRMSSILEAIPRHALSASHPVWVDRSGEKRPRFVVT